MARLLALKDFQGNCKPCILFRYMFESAPQLTCAALRMVPNASDSEYNCYAFRRARYSLIFGRPNPHS